MKRFLVFAYDNFYPLSPKEMASGEFDTIEEAREFSEGARDNYDILDMEKREWVQ